ncbi:hypothetical protein XENOCAPTIV_008452 [Xenoophorus captivus]|uniref:UBA domain-containing protein n=1 Tax=Xenoophorus captivus TaxID=1517983 RepID=A0ABV0Q8X6_9TELE
MAFRGSSPQGLDNPALLQQMLLANPHELSLLKERNPPLAEALLSGDLERFTKVLLEQQQDRAKREQERIRLLTADPFDLDAQAKIEEDISSGSNRRGLPSLFFLHIGGPANGHAAWPGHAEETPGAHVNPTLDRSQSAPPTMQQAPAPRPPERSQSLSPEKDVSPPHSVHVHPLPLQSKPNLSPVPSPSSDMFHTCTPPANISTESQDPSSETPPEATEGDVESDEVESTSMQTAPEECLPEQPMDQERTECDAADTTEADSVAMECPSASAEREQPDGDRCSSSDSIPSLAAALKELHELLVQSQNRSISCSPSHAHGQDSDKASPEPGTPTPENAQPAHSTASAAGAETSDAKANYAAAVCDEEPAQCPVPDLPGQAERLHEDTVDTEEGLGPPRCPDSSEDRAGQDREETCVSGVSDPEPEVSHGSAVVPEFREPPEGQHGRGVADGQASSTDIPETLQIERAFLSPASAAVNPPEEDSSVSSSSALLLTQATPSLLQAPHPPSPHPFMEQFPVEHIQRIQAAGFSAREAVEALEQAHGVVEIALLALLARSITVPT